MEQTDEYLELKKSFDAFKNLYAMVLNDSITLEKRLRLMHISFILLMMSIIMLLIALYKIYFIGC